MISVKEDQCSYIEDWSRKSNCIICAEPLYESIGPKKIAK